MVEQVLFAFVFFWRAGNGHSLHLTGAVFAWRWEFRLVIEFGEIGHVEIQITVVIVVSEGCTHAPLGEAPTRIGHSCGFAHFGKRPIAVVAIKLVGTEVGHIQIQVTVIIIIAHRDTAAPGGISQMRLFGNVGESPVTIVPQQVIMRRMGGLLKFAGRPIDQIDILITVVVVIDEGSTFPVDIDQVLRDFIAADDLIRNPCWLGDIGKYWERFLRAIARSHRMLCERDKAQSNNENNRDLHLDPGHAIFSTKC